MKPRYLLIALLIFGSCLLGACSRHDETVVTVPATNQVTRSNSSPLNADSTTNTSKVTNAPSGSNRVPSFATNNVPSSLPINH